MGVSCCRRKSDKNDDIDTCENISDLRNYISTKLKNAEFEQEEINLYLEDKRNIPTTVEVEGFSEEDLKKRVLYLEEMKNCLNEIDDLLKKHPNVDIIDVIKSLKEFQNMYAWIFDDSKRYQQWLNIFREFVENN